MNYEKAIADLTERVEQAEERAREAEERAREAEERAEELAEENEEQERRIQALTAHVRQQANEIDRVDDNVAGAYARISNIDASEDEDNEDRTNDTDPDSPPISMWVSLPEHLAEDRLEPNEERARRFFKNVRQYASKTPGGRAIKGGELKRVLIASEPDDSDATIDSKTVERVMHKVRIATRDVAEINQPNGRNTERTLFIPDDWAEEARSRAPSRTDTGTPGESDAAAT